MKDLKIGFGVIGSVLTLDALSCKHTNGSCDYFYFLKILTRISNVKQVVLLSASNYPKLTSAQKEELDPFNKIVYIHDQFQRPGYQYKKCDMSKYATRAEAQFQFIHDAKNILNSQHSDIDFNLIYFSQGGTNWNIPNAKKTKNGEGNLDLEMTYNYAAPILEYLNNTKVPWGMMFPDPRWLKSSEQFGNLTDLWHLPNFVMGQADVTLPWRYVTQYDPTTLTTEKKYEKASFNCRYGEIEKVNGFGKTMKDPASPRPHDFTIVAMQSSSEGSAKDYRYEQLKKYILSTDKEQKFDIYGKWDESYTKGYPQFKGLLTKEELGKVLAETKYTLVIPLRKKWASYKYIEMLLEGTVPFFHPDYDVDNFIVPADSFLRVKSPEDFKKKIDFLNEHDDQRIMLVKKLQDKLLGDIVSGNFLPKVLNRFCTENNLDLEFGEVQEYVSKKKKFFS